jgi:hypothetical protein
VITKLRVWNFTMNAVPPTEYGNSALLFANKTGRAQFRIARSFIAIRLPPDRFILLAGRLRGDDKCYGNGRQPICWSDIPCCSRLTIWASVAHEVLRSDVRFRK